LSGDSQARQGFFERALLILFLLSLPLVNPWVRGDGVGYYAYARAPLVEHSLDFTRDYQFANQSFRGDRIGPDGVPKAAYRTCTGHLENHFTVGPAILWSPFLLAAHAGVLLARAFGSSIPADGFSAPYRYAMALGTALYGFLALLLSFRMAQKYLSIRGAFLATLAVWGGSSLAVYMYFNPSWSHAHSAFAAALFFWYWERTRENRTVQQWLIFGLITALLLNVYYANAMLVVVVLMEAIPLYAGAFRGEKPPEAPGVGQLLSRHLLYGVVVADICLPLGGVWQPVCNGLSVAARFSVGFASFLTGAFFRKSRAVFLDTASARCFGGLDPVCAPLSNARSGVSRGSFQFLYFFHALSGLGRHFLLRQPVFRVAHAAVYSGTGYGHRFIFQTFRAS
jgi:hypothetical protein